MTQAWKKIGLIGLVVALGLSPFALQANAGEAKVVHEPAEVGAVDAATAEDIINRVKQQDTIKEQRDRFLSEHFTKSGIALFDELNYDAAKLDFEKALEYNPNNLEAKEHLRKTETILGLRDARYHKILDKVRDQKIVERPLAHHEMKIAYEKAKDLAKEGDYEEAIERFERVRELVKWISPYFNEDDLEPYRSQVEEQIKSAESQQEAKEEQDRQRARLQADEVARIGSQHLRERREKRIDKLLAKGRDLLAETRYDEAQSLAESILDLDPTNAQAKALRNIAFKASMAADIKWTLQTDGEERQLSWAAVKKSQIPHSIVLIYPDNWAEIMKREHEAIGADEDVEPAWVEGLKATLERKISFDFVETPLRDVVSFLQQITNATIILDENVVDQLANPEITLKVADMKLNIALDWIVEAVDLEYALRDEAIFISNEQAVGGDAKLKLYDVTDVTLEIKDFPGNLQMLRDRVGTSVGGSGGVSSDVGGDWEDWGDEGDTGESTFTPERLIQFIKSTIAPDTWDEVN